MTRLFLSALLCLVGLSAAAAECAGQTPCAVGDRSYHLRVPDGWDGVSPLPVLLHFHGWGRQGSLTVRHGRIAVGYVAEHVLLVAPNGLNGSWAFRRPGSRDTDFAEAVLADVAKRYPIDRQNIFVSGYSWGANMAWRFVCESRVAVAGLLAVSGTLSQRETCARAPREMRQVFGLGDGVLAFPMGPGGDQTYPVALWRQRMGCGEGVSEGAWNARPFLTFERTRWDCADGKVVLDVHPGGHFIPHDWIPIQVGEILGLR
ncbi:putative esterase lipoprotein LPQC [Candidatus Rhodobacter oscarellae]|uniref:Putative esterase lipoprotein LPQC n=1 Tax=Candidatus Rhodobacter oscarellae TaxID=1675527 RepID=A0A0J9H2L9_9RHOB|nr:polyhydroxybutyrate depolymerase [Candidatus Rhodobacter lobularis]KMW59918.1 putative esterase lipoprotein LPQC [Candidatus Rhodobacter lobularis]